MDAAAALRYAQAQGVQPVGLELEMHRSHVFTHIRWEMVGYLILCRAEAPGFVWADENELRDKYALPTAFRQFLP
jgi:A/G-specific adenine glycosylase